MPSSSVGSGTLFQLDNFEQPEPINRGSTVRNLLAFQVLQSVFIKSKSDYLDTIVLDAVSTIYSADNANYFLSENLRCQESFQSVNDTTAITFHLLSFSKNERGRMGAFQDVCVA